MMSWMIVVVLLVVFTYAILIYNSLVMLKHNVSKAWSNIDVSLKQRHEEIPKLIAVCQEYMAFEKETLVKVMQARNQVATAQGKQDINSLGMAEQMLRGGLGQLFAVAEAYPELGSNSQFQHLQQRITQLDSEISDRREFYNDSVNLNNIRIEQFPDVIIANLLNFKAFDLLEFAEQELQDVNVKQLFAQK